jgi:YVTN family beta-propeller protein
MIDTTTYAWQGNLANFPGQFFSAAFTPNGVLYITHGGGDEVIVNPPFGAVSVGINPFGIAVTPDGKQAYVTNSGDGSVSVIDTQLNKVLGTAISTESRSPANSAPFGIAIQPLVTAQSATGTALLSGGPIDFTAGGPQALVSSVSWQFSGNGSQIQTTPLLSTQATPYLAAGTFFPKVTVLTPAGSVLFRKTIPLHVQSPFTALRTAAVLVKVLPTLTPTQQNSLASTLGLARFYLSMGNKTGAINQVGLFINGLNALVQTGQLTAKAAAPALGEGRAIAESIDVSVPGLGTGELSPRGGSSRVGEPVTFTATWRVPEGKSWRSLQYLDLRLVESAGDALKDASNPPVALWARFNVGNPSTIALLDANGNVVGEGEPGSAGVLETNTATLDLADSSFQGTGPTGPSVTVNFVVRFKTPAAGEHSARVYRTDLLATDLLEQIQASDESGHWAIRPSDR